MPAPESSERGTTGSERAAVPPRTRRRLTVLAVAFLPVGCVVVEERPAPGPPLLAAPIAIPLGAAAGGAGPQPGDAYYESIVTQMQRAWLDRDREHLARLLDTHDREDAPSWAREHLVGFRRILRAMEFEEVASDRGTVALPKTLPHIGESLALVVQLGPLPHMPVRLLGGKDAARARFVVVLTMRDRDCFGTEAVHASNVVVDLAAPVDFAAGDAVDLPVSIEVEGRGSILRHVEVEVFLMPGHVEVAGVRLPNRRVRCAHGEIELLPKGHEPIAARPLQTLLGALRLGDAAHFPHVYLAARQLAHTGDPGERAAAEAALIDRLRLGRAEQGRNAMAALGQLEPDVARTVVDRVGWLQWWSLQGSLGTPR